MRENDLISRKALVKALIAEREKYPPEVAERYSFGVKLPHRFNQAVRGAIRMALRYIETAPAIDAEPVRHGRWIEVDRITWRGADDHPIDITVEEKCSNCGRYVERYETVQQENYCPSCGAKMDLKEE